ncbi:MAG TPA: hypothetical protein VLG47_08295 [Candidatus Saccharimonadales bacterium]|nr:hypothetical protein [Candidatus Saccharimonadales bacterium]
MTDATLVRQGARESQETERRKDFIERMERKLAQKVAMKHRRRTVFRSRLQRLREW